MVGIVLMDIYLFESIVAAGQLIREDDTVGQEATIEDRTVLPDLPEGKTWAGGIVPILLARELRLGRGR